MASSTETAWSEEKQQRAAVPSPTFNWFYLETLKTSYFLGIKQQSHFRDRYWGTFKVKVRCHSTRTTRSLKVARLILLILWCENLSWYKLKIKIVGNINLMYWLRTHCNLTVFFEGENRKRTATLDELHLTSDLSDSNQPGTFKISNHSWKLIARSFLLTFELSGCFLWEKSRLRTKLLHFGGKGKLQMFLAPTAAVPAGQ